MLKRTPLYEQHLAAHAKMVEFAGWEMPIHYGSQIQEHHQVRNAAGMFDVSHMGVLDVSGEDATVFLRYALANDIQKLNKIGRALYSCLLNAQGGVVDDLIVYRLGEQQFRLVLNAGACQKDIAWLEKISQAFKVQRTPRNELGILALQGPQAIQKLSNILTSQANALHALKPFHALIIDEMQIARTGYTGEDGVEIIAPAKNIQILWQRCLTENIQPCGLGARDTLRLEAGLNLYGSDMDEHTSPLISNLAWTVDWKDEQRNFMGKEALLTQKREGVREKLVGIVMEQPGVLRDHQPILIDNQPVGEITSGGFSPTLGHAIALARVPSSIGDAAFVERRGKQIPVKIIKPPFIKQNQRS